MKTNIFLQFLKKQKESLSAIHVKIAMLHFLKLLTPQTPRIPGPWGTFFVQKGTRGATLYTIHMKIVKKLYKKIFLKSLKKNKELIS